MIDAGFLASLVEQPEPVAEVSDFRYFAWHTTSNLYHRVRRGTGRKTISGAFLRDPPCPLWFKLLLSLPGERRGPFFHVGGQTFLAVIALEQDLLILALDGQSRFHWDFPSCLHGPFDASHSLRGFVRRCDLTRVLHDVLREPVALEDVV